MRFVMRVAAGEKAVSEISQQKYYYRQRCGEKRPLCTLISSYHSYRLIVTVTFQLYA